MAAEAVKAFGRIDILVNNAAIFIDIQRHPFYEISAEEWDRVSAVNIKGPFLCAKAVFPQMKEQRSGKIINISSSTAYWGTPNFLHYVASKAALIGMTRSLAREVGDYGICVNAIAPGLVEHEGQTAPKALTELQLKARSIKRLQTPEDLVGTLVFLCFVRQRLHDRAGDCRGWGKHLSLRFTLASRVQLLPSPSFSPAKAGEGTGMADAQVSLRAMRFRLPRPFRWERVGEGALARTF